MPHVEKILKIHSKSPVHTSGSELKFHTNTDKSIYLATLIKTISTLAFSIEHRNSKGK